MQLNYNLEKDGSSGYIAYCPVMKPVSVYGKTEQEAAEKLKEAIGLYLSKHPDILKNIRTASVEI